MHLTSTDFFGWPQHLSHPKPEKGLAVPRPQPAGPFGSLLELPSSQTHFLPPLEEFLGFATLAKASLLLARVRDVQMMHQRPLNGPRWLRVFVLYPIDSPWSSASQNRSQVCREGPAQLGTAELPQARRQYGWSPEALPSLAAFKLTSSNYSLPTPTHTYHKEGA